MTYNMRGREPRPHRLEIRMTGDEMDMLNQLCLAEDRTASAIVRAALRQYADRTARHEEAQGDHAV